MASSMKAFKHLEIQLEDIKSATNNFSEENVIGRGGFGNVYKGELAHSHSEGKSMVAIKRLDRRHGQGDREFYKEVRMLSCYRHENIISLLGFSSGPDEMILMYEYASRGSLDRYLKDITFTWAQRIKVCLDAAKGLCYLHDPRDTYQRLIHCDIKSANILVDDNFNAKVADFGLSKIGPASQQNSILVTGASGTHGYCDPVFMETYTLTKESDVYSFGVVLFEVLCGKLCIEYSKGQIKAIHVPMWKQSYEQKQLSGIVLQGLTEQMNPDSLEIFADIAYKCLKRFREERPTTSLVVEKLEESFALQVFHDLKLPKESIEIAKAAVPPLIYRSTDELKVLLTKGFHVNQDKTRLLCVNEKGEHFERIYIQACLHPAEIRDSYFQHPSGDIVNSRFPGGRCYQYMYALKSGVRGQYLTPHISYKLNLVFRVDSYKYPLRYKIDGETKVFMIYKTYMRQDGWFVVPLYHFTSQSTTANLQFEFLFRSTTLLVAGFEFQPYEEKVELQVFEEYQHIIEAASQSLFCKSLDELKQILRIGIYLKDYKTWFSLNEKGQQCHMISMKDCLISKEDFTQYVSHNYSRFPAGLYDTEQKGFKTHVTTQLLNPSIPYTVNLVIYVSSSHKQEYIDLKYRINGETRTSNVYLANWRDDFVYIAELYQVTSNGGLFDLEIEFDDHGTKLKVEGILFQPLEKVEDQVLEDEKVEDIQPILDSDSDTYWGQKLPHDYEKILKLTNHSVEGKTKKEFYSILCQGFFITNGQQWFTVDKNGKKCQLLSARATCAINEKNSTWQSSNESRFEEQLVITVGYTFEIVSNINYSSLSPDTAYESYLVYKSPQDRSAIESPLRVTELKYGSLYYYYAYNYLVSPPNTPVIGENLDENSYNPLNRHKLNALPRQRSDGWMEVKVWDFRTSSTTPETVSVKLKFEHPVKKDLRGLIIQGIDIRPV